MICCLLLKEKNILGKMTMHIEDSKGNNLLNLIPAENPEKSFEEYIN
jgi:hypothetical protein